MKVVDLIDKDIGDIFSIISYTVENIVVYLYLLVNNYKNYIKSI